MNSSICIISQRYPSKVNPTVHVFVQKLVWAFADMGIEVSVISPVSCFGRDSKGIPDKYIECTDNGNKITIYRPRFIYFGQKFTRPIKTSHLSMTTFYNACRKVIEQNNIKPDAFYGHFICLAGICAAKLGREYNKPSYFAFGESTDWSYRHYGIKAVRKELETITGAVAVSTRNKQILVENELVSENKIKVFVNGVNVNRFYPRDKKESRNKFGFKEDKFLIAFVGQFIERKGVLNVSNAIRELGDVQGIFAGAGSLKPKGENVVFADKVKPEDMPYFLSSADIFVFPSTNEGCSNAVLEAMACGLPIVATDAEFNYDLLDKSNAILVKADDIAALTGAITKLKEDVELRESMSRVSLEKIKNLSIEARANNILKWMNLK